ncbi:MAG: hypothetical protein ACREEV_16165, partial [Dongiaceae bacterium]
MATLSPESAEIEPRPRVSERVMAAALAWLARSAAEERERWVLWVPVLIGVGIAAYFGLASEPPPWAGAAGLSAAISLRIVLR